LPEKLVTVAIPTLAADSKLADCVRSLAEQTRQDFEIVVIDNSGASLARKTLAPGENLRFIENDSNIGFGAAINQAYSSSQSSFLATLNDDAVATPRWLEELLAAAESRPDVMWAPQVRLMGGEQTQVAGMLICGDGSSAARSPPRRRMSNSRPRGAAPSGSAGPVSAGDARADRDRRGFFLY
jgi:GT2 family glycosyltransferase